MNKYQHCCNENQFRYSTIFLMQFPLLLVNCKITPWTLFKSTWHNFWHWNFKILIFVQRWPIVVDFETFWDCNMLNKLGTRLDPRLNNLGTIVDLQDTYNQYFCTYIGCLSYLSISMETSEAMSPDPIFHRKCVVFGKMSPTLSPNCI